MNRTISTGVLALLLLAGLLLTACERKEQKAGTYNDRESADDYTDSGDAYYHKKDYDRAIADYNQAIRLNPNYAYAYYSRGFAYYHKKDYDHAIADLTSALRLNPNYVDVYSIRGNAYFNKGDYDRAIPDYEAVLRIEPNHALAKGNLELAKAKRSSPPQSVAQQPQSNNSQQKTTTPSNSSTGRLNNTTWYYEGKTVSIPTPIGGGRYDMSGSYTTPSETLYFGNGNYRLENETGTFTVSGDTVTLTSTSGSTKTGSVIGNSLRIDSRTYTRIQ